MRGTRKSRSDFGFGRHAEEWLKDQLPKGNEDSTAIGREAAGSDSLAIGETFEPLATLFGFWFGNGKDI